MGHASAVLRGANRSILRLTHPWVDALAPVTYTLEETEASKELLDPTHARNQPGPNAVTDTRILNLGRLFGIDENDGRRILDEARECGLATAARVGGRDLASPMSYEDRYTLYFLTRALAPRVVVETGVAHGVSSAFILAAMNANGVGRLVSIDIDDDPSIGDMVPAELRARWTLHIGDSRRLLPEVLREHRPVDMFVCDSLHTYRQMWFEFQTAWPNLRPGGVLCAHDILETNAFARFVRRRQDEIEWYAENVNLGLIVKSE